MKILLSSAQTFPAQRFKFALSLKNPIIGFRKSHPRVGPPFFDMHYPLELGIVLSGRLRRYYQNLKTDLHPGQFYLCGIWETTGREILEAPCDIMILVILPEFLFHLFAPESRPFDWLLPFKVPPRQRPQSTDRTRKYFMDIGLRLAQVLSEPEESKKLWLRVLFMEAMLSMTANWHPPVQTAVTLSSQSFERINKAIDLVFSERRHVNTVEAARVCGLSRNHFSNLFRSIMGIDFAVFALRHRLSRAACQAQSTSDPLKKIACDWGFADTSHLHRLFVQFYKCTPRMYRNKMTPGHKG